MLKIVLENFRNERGHSRTQLNLKKTSSVEKIQLKFSGISCLLNLLCKFSHGFRQKYIRGKVRWNFFSKNNNFYEIVANICTNSHNL